MNKNYLTQSEIASTELIYSQAVTAFEEANNNMAKAVEKLINTLSKIDESLLKPKRKMTIRYIDGEEVYTYSTSHIEFDEDDTILVICDDDCNEETAFELYDLSFEEIQCLGAILFDNYMQKYGTKKTYKDMVEMSKK